MQKWWGRYQPFLSTIYGPGFGGGGFNPKKPKPKMVVLGFLGFLEKGVESTFLDIPDHLRPTCFLHFFREISLGSDTIFNIRNFNFSQKNQPRQILKGLKYLLKIKSTRVTLQWQEDFHNFFLKCP